MIRTYDQGAREWSKPLCRYWQHITIASNNTDTEVTDNDFEHLKNFLGPKKLDRGGGKKEASQTIERRWNERKQKKIKTVELVLFSKRRWQYVDAGYQVSVSIAVLDEFVRDYRDGTIDTKMFTKGKAYGHVIGIKKIGNDMCFINTWSSKNIVKIPRENIEGLNIWRDRESYTYKII